jgi:hypothetical protein
MTVLLFIGGSDDSNPIRRIAVADRLDQRLLVNVGTALWAASRCRQDVIDVFSGITVDPNGESLAYIKDQLTQFNQNTRPMSIGIGPLSKSRGGQRLPQYLLWSRLFPVMPS